MTVRNEFDQIVSNFADIYNDAAARVVREELEAHLAEHGTLSEEHAQRFAMLAGRSVRTVRRWQQLHARTGASPVLEVPSHLPASGDVLGDLLEHGPASFEFDDVMVSLMYLVQANQAEFRRLLVEAGYPMPSAATLSRKWAALNPMVRAGATTGLRERASKLLHIRHSASDPNEAWQFDAFSLDIHVRAPQGVKTVRPNGMLLVDDCSRFIVSSPLIPGAMKSRDVLAALGDGFEVRPADNGTGVLIGGWPDLLTTDNESSIVSNEVREALDVLPMTVKLSPAFTPTDKGKVERCGATIQEIVLSTLPGRVTKSERLNKTHLLDVATGDLLSWEKFEELFAAAVYHYNYERPHSALGGKTPFEAYTDGWTKRELSDEELASMMLPVFRSGGIRKVHHDGIHAFSRYFLHPDLADLIGKKVEVRSWHHRHDRVAVYAGDKFVCIATDSSHLTEDQRRDILETRFVARHAVLHHASAVRAATVAHGKALELGAAESPVEIMQQVKRDKAADKAAAATVAPPAATAPKPPAATGSKQSKSPRPSKPRPPRNANSTAVSVTEPVAADESKRSRARRVAEATLEDTES